jgi:hypothetical protein
MEVDHGDKPEPGGKDILLDDDDYDRNGSHRFVEKMPGILSDQALQDVKMHPVQNCHARVMYYSFDHRTTGLNMQTTKQYVAFFQS